MAGEICAGSISSAEIGFLSFSFPFVKSFKGSKMHPEIVDSAE